MPPTSTTVKVSARSAGVHLRCAYCHTAFGREALLCCVECRTLVHGSCAELSPACPTFGCEALFGPEPEPERPPRERSAWMPVLRSMMWFAAALAVSLLLLSMWADTSGHTAFLESTPEPSQASVFDADPQAAAPENEVIPLALPSVNDDKYFDASNHEGATFYTLEELEEPDDDGLTWACGHGLDIEELEQRIAAGQGAEVRRELGLDAAGAR